MPKPFGAAQTAKNRTRVKSGIVAGFSAAERKVQSGLKSAGDKAYELIKKLSPAVTKAQAKKTAGKK